jgi:hypothetical protein
MELDPVLRKVNNFPVGRARAGSKYVCMCGGGPHSKNIKLLLMRGGSGGGLRRLIRESQLRRDFFLRRVVNLASEGCRSEGRR